MSEPNSVYAKITISKAQLKAYLSAPIKPLKHSKQWFEWMGKQKYYGHISEKDLVDLGFYYFKTHQEFLDVYIKEETAFGEFNYNEEKQELIISILLFSENILDMIRMYHVIGSISLFKKSNRADFVVIFGFMWGLEEEDYIEITKGDYIIKYNLPYTVKSKANQYLAKRRKLASKLFKD